MCHLQVALRYILYYIILIKLTINAYTITITNFYLVVATYAVGFEQEAYSVNESSKNVQPVLILSGPSSTNITVKVFNTDESAIGK